jgi:cell division protein YceG involved in septum cleavage
VDYRWLPGQERRAAAGPIASPGKGALLAVANPATHNYIFFLSGDDDVTYFGVTDADHERNIREHCQKKCQIL